MVRRRTRAVPDRGRGDEHALGTPLRLPRLVRHRALPVPGRRRAGSSPATPRGTARVVGHGAARASLASTGASERRHGCQLVGGTYAKSTVSRRPDQVSVKRQQPTEGASTYEGPGPVVMIRRTGAPTS